MTLLLIFPKKSQAYHYSENSCLQDVGREVSRLHTRGKYLRIRTTNAFPAGSVRPPYSLNLKNTWRHIQGVTRLRNSNVLVMSGNAKGGSYLYVGKMKSQPEDYDWQSNVKCKSKWYWFGRKKCSSPSSDRFYKVMHLSNKLLHPGGIQSAGDILAVGLDGPSGQLTEVRFYDFQNPLQAKEFSHARITRFRYSAEAVALVKLQDHQYGGKYLLIALSGSGARLTFYISTTNNFNDPHFQFFQYANWIAKDHFKLSPYQAINFIQQCDGSLFLFGTFKSKPLLGLPWGGKDWLHTYQVKLFDRDQKIDKDTGFPIPKLIRKTKKHLTMKKSYLTAGGGVYVNDRDGSLRLYSTDYWPLNPFKRDTVICFEEFTSN